MEYCMNDRDQNNLNYIMSLTETQFDEWMLEVSNDDINYAIELIQARRAELIEQEHELLENELDVSEAAALLKKYTLS